MILENKNLTSVWTHNYQEGKYSRNYLDGDTIMGLYKTKHPGE